MIMAVLGSIGWCLAFFCAGILIGERRIASKVLDELRRGPLDRIDGRPSAN